MGNKQKRLSLSKALSSSLVILILFAGFAVAGLLYEHFIMPKKSEAECVPTGCGGVPNTFPMEFTNAVLCLKEGASISASCKYCAGKGKGGGCKSWARVDGYARINGGQVQTRVRKLKFPARESGWVDGKVASVFGITATAGSGGVRVTSPCTSDWSPW